MSKFKYTINDCYKLAREKEGKFISYDYLKASNKYQWKCKISEHPIFDKTFTQVKQGQWCPKCRYIKASNALRGRSRKNNVIYDIAFCQSLAKERNGICLSTQYITSNTKMKWKCNICNHIWEAEFSSIYNQGTWCPRCAGKAKNKDDCIKKAKSWGGEFLGDKYEGYFVPMKWKCNNGHIFMASWESIANGHWCTECSSSIGERICRGIIQRIYGEDFVKIRMIPTNISKNPLELDGYNEKLRLAFEYQGAQHLKFIKHFYKDLDKFEQRKLYDHIKIEWCKQNSIKLLVIEDFKKYDNLEFIINVIEKAIKEAGLDIPVYKKPKTIGEILISELDELNQLCEKNGGKVLTDAFLGWTQKHEFECSQGHRWTTTASSIKAGCWCKKCRLKESGLKSRKYTIEDAKKIAIERNGKCLSTFTSIKNNTYLNWYCNIHKITWSIPLANIISGSWCPLCGREKCDKNRRAYTIEELKEIAQKKGGECLSPEYTRADAKYLWKCKFGHTWETSFNEIKGSEHHQATWCPYCSQKAKKTIEDMKVLASMHNGECLSPEYYGAFKHLKWKCEYGHEFSAQPTNVQQGKWCPQCKGKRIWETRRKK